MVIYSLLHVYFHVSLEILNKLQLTQEGTVREDGLKKKSVLNAPITFDCFFAVGSTAYQLAHDMHKYPFLSVDVWVFNKKVIHGRFHATVSAAVTGGTEERSH